MSAPQKNERPLPGGRQDAALQEKDNSNPTETIRATQVAPNSVVVEDLAARRSRKRREAFDESEIELADLFVIKNIGRYRSVSDIGIMEWDGTRWRRDRRRRHFDDVRKHCRRRGLDTSMQTAKVVAAIVKLISADQRIVAVPDDFDADRMTLNTPAGLLDLRTLDLTPHACQLVTKCTSVAASFNAPIRWLKFLADVFDGDDEVIAFVRRLCGYLLTGQVSEQVVIFCHGTGANGKSVLLDLLLFIFGDYGLKVDARMLMRQRFDRHPTEIAQLAGVRLAVANEIAEGEFWDEARLKELSGDARLTARFMRQDNFQFNASHTFLVAGNTRPRFRAVDHAIRRRLVLLPFRRTFAGAARDPDMLGKLKTEAADILGWMAIGAAEWAEDGLRVPGAIRDASDDYCDAMDFFGMWLAECCTVASDITEKSSLLYRSFSNWKRQRGESPVSQTIWGEEMRSRGFASYTSNGTRYRGVALSAAELQRVTACSPATP